MSFKKGDIIFIRRQIDKNWYEGEHNAMIGLLPVQYVDVRYFMLTNTHDFFNSLIISSFLQKKTKKFQIVTNEGSIRPITPLKKPTEGQARARFNFQAQSDIELSLNKGELVALTRRVDPNWYEGRIGSKKGIFPVTYVDVLTDIGADDAENVTQTTVTTVTKQLAPSPIPHNVATYSATYTTTTPNDIVRETKTVRKTEVLHVDTSNEPIR